MRDKVASGVAWSIAEKVGSMLLQMGVSIVILRLLTPEQMGIMAIPVVFSSLALVMVDSGFSQTLIRKAVPSEEDEIVITADTMVFLDQQRLGKPKDEADALRMLTDLAGRRHTVCTGVTLRQGQRSLTRAQSTDVYFRPAGQEELMAYIRGGEPMDKAGAYGVQGQGALLVERIDGDFFNVMGLPVLLLSRMLAEFGVTLL